MIQQHSERTDIYHTIGRLFLVPVVRLIERRRYYWFEDVIAPDFDLLGYHVTNSTQVRACR